MKEKLFPRICKFADQVWQQSRGCTSLSQGDHIWMLPDNPRWSVSKTRWYLFRQFSILYCKFRGQIQSIEGNSASSHSWHSQLLSADLAGPVSCSGLYTVLLQLYSVYSAPYTVILQLCSVLHTVQNTALTDYHSGWNCKILEGSRRRREWARPTWMNEG